LLLATVLRPCLAVDGIGEGVREWPAVLVAIGQGVLFSLNGHQFFFLILSGIMAQKSILNDHIHRNNHLILAI
jgi:hypothetical protein